MRWGEPGHPAGRFYTGGRVLRFADGPDEVHLQTIAKLELKDSAHRRMEISRYMTPRQ